MALPTITFNSGTGSDTAASGSGGTAVTAGGNDGAATSAASGVVDLSADAPDLSGVATDGSMALWVSSSSGRQFSKITGTDDTAKTVTCESTYANTESGKAWGIGGKRATLDAASSRTVFATTGALAGWTIVVEDSQTIATTITLSPSGDTTNGWITLKGDSTTTRRVITISANSRVFSPSGNLWKIENLQLACSNGTKTNAVGLFIAGGTDLLVRNCILGHATSTLLSGIVRSAGSPMVQLIDVAAISCTSHGVNVDGGIAINAKGCHFDGNAGAGLQLSSTVRSTIEDCTITDNTGDGINLGNASTRLDCRNCTIDGNGGDGIDGTTSVNIAQGITIVNCQITNNIGTGLNFASNANKVVSFVDYNNFFQNGTDRSNMDAGAHDTALDPQYTSAATDDYSIGTNTKAKGFPDATLNIGAGQSATKSYVDIGAAQRQEAGSGAPYHGAMAGGLIS